TPLHEGRQQALGLRLGNVLSDVQVHDRAGRAEPAPDERGGQDRQRLARRDDDRVAIDRDLDPLDHARRYLPVLFISCASEAGPATRATRESSGPAWKV